MNPNVLFIAMVLFTFIGIAFVVAFFITITKIDELKTQHKIYSSLLRSTKEVLDTISEQYSCIYRQEKLVTDAFEGMVGQYKILSQYYKDAMDASNVACEQFKLCTDELIKIEKLLEPGNYDADYLGDSAMKNLIVHEAETE